MLEWTGERYVPWVDDVTLHYEHLHRYALARDHARGRRVIDLACGEGYGAALLSGVAAFVLGVDIDPDTIQHATAAYQRTNLRFLAGSIVSLPLMAPVAFDMAVCFEALEHVEDQGALLAEAKRVLKPDGLLIVSTPNKDVYEDDNPFHRRELSLAEFRALLGHHFAHACLLGQTVSPLSSIVPVDEALSGATSQTIRREGPGFAFDQNALVRTPRYVIALASDRPLTEPVPASFLVDASDALRLEESKRMLEIAAHQRKLEDALAGKDAHLAKVGAHVLRLEEELARKEAHIERVGAYVRRLEEELARKEAYIEEVVANVRRLQEQLSRARPWSTRLRNALRHLRSAGTARTG